MPKGKKLADSQAFRISIIRLPSSCQKMPTSMSNYIPSKPSAPGEAFPYFQFTPKIPDEAKITASHGPFFDDPCPSYCTFAVPLSLLPISYSSPIYPADR